MNIANQVSSSTDPAKPSPSTGNNSSFCNTTQNAAKPATHSINNASSNNDASKTVAVPEDNNTVINRKRLLEKTEYEDLATEPVKKTATLNLAKIDRYLSGPTAISSSSSAISGQIGSQPDMSPQSIMQWRQNLVVELKNWSTSGNCRDILSARTAVSALNDLSPGGALMKAARKELLAGQYPDSVLQDLKLLYGSLSELLRHFWACFPPTTTQLQEKAIKMHDTLQKYQAKKLRPFEKELVRQYSSGPKITGHINEMLDAAYRKFSTWQQKISTKR